MFSILFVLVGIIGEYIAILFNELKDRPIYIVEKTKNLEGTKESDILYQIDNIDSSANKRL